MHSPKAKRLCNVSDNMTVKIGTHNGTFHCDEVLACFFLTQLPEYKVDNDQGVPDTAINIISNLTKRIKLAFQLTLVKPVLPGVRFPKPVSNW